MSVSTADPSPRPLDLQPNANGEFDLVGMLLQQQQELSAVERFSVQHEKAVEAAALATAPAQEKYYRSLLPATPPTEDQQFAFEVDLDSCSGCKACVVACHTLNGLEENESWRKVGVVTIGEPSVGVQHVTTACHHCEDPGCLNGCPVKAYDKDPVTGIVRHLDDQCIGCKYCTMMCPYEVPKYSDRLGIVRKCDMCHNRLAVGEAPACVQSCPNEAISIRLVNRVSGKATDRFSDDSALAAGAPPSNITLPTTVYKTRGKAVHSRPHDDGIDEVAESHWPLAALLIATQISVGMLLTERVFAVGLWLSGEAMPLNITAVVCLAALLVGGAGLNLAPLHLGKPLRSWRVFLGLRTSWLSREAVVLGKYMGALTVATTLLWVPLLQSYLPEIVIENYAKYVPDWAAKLALGLSLPLGMAGLYSSAMIYIATKRPLWRYGRTLPRFAGTTLLGGIAFGVATMLACVNTLGIAASAWTSLATIFVLLATGSLIVKLVWEWMVHLGPTVAEEHPHDQRCRRLVSRDLSTLRVARLGLGWAAVAGLTMTAWALIAAGASSWAPVVLCGIAACLILASESCERLLYFMSVVYDRMPGTLR